MTIYSNQLQSPEEASTGVASIATAIKESTRSPDKLFFLNDKSIIEIDANSTCSFYLNCGDCINPRTLTDGIVDCKWEGDRCIPGRSDDACTPFVDISRSGPFRGPSKGGNLLTLQGFDFGNLLDNSLNQIKIGDRRCTIKSFTNTTIKCIVPETSVGGHDANITLQITDLHHDERMKKYQISTNGPMKVHLYTYYNVEFKGVFPSYGPVSGGTHLTLVGVNIGSNDTQSDQLHYKLYGESTDGRVDICDHVQVINSSHLICNTTKFSHANLPQLIENLAIEIDGKSYYAASTDASDNVAEQFVYKRDPSEINLDPGSNLHFYFQGGLARDIVFRGMNLDAAVDPRLEVHPFGQTTVQGPCVSNRTTVSCKAPSLLNNKISQRSLEQPIQARMRLLIDGFTFEVQHKYLVYYPNATLNLANIDQVVLNPDGKSRFILQGKHLLPLEKVNVTVKVDDKICELIEITDTNIVCNAQVGIGLHKVHVTIANKEVKPRSYEGQTVVVGSAPGMAWGAVVAIVISLLVLVIVASLLAFYYRRMRSKTIKDEPVVAYRPDNDGYLHPDNERLLTTIPPDPEIIQQLSDWGLLMDFSCIQVGALIGKGQFGCVYRSILKRDKMSEEEPVAVKTLQQQGYTTNDANIFLKEALRMKDFNHPNVLGLIGVSFDNNNATDPMIIVPYMANGDLLEYIRNQDNTPTVKDLITFGANIAQGMAYLASQKFVHRDLAARNCMVGEDMIVRVADFGLSRDVYETSYYSSDNAKTKLPVKWMAIESLSDGHYSHKSDVWSYGVVLWELMTRGCQPYPSVDNWNIHLWLKEGRRMLQPAFCPNALYRIMLQCWHEDPAQRPTFSELVKDVPNVIHTIEMATRNAVPQYVNT